MHETPEKYRKMGIMKELWLEIPRKMKLCGYF